MEITDRTPSGKPRIGYSVSSGQRRLGPAPLASFEDLPSDEQFSPDSERGLPLDIELDPDEHNQILDLDYRRVLERAPNDECPSPAGTITPTNNSSEYDHNEIGLARYLLSQQGNELDTGNESNCTNNEQHVPPSPHTNGDMIAKATAVITSNTMADSEPTPSTINPSGLLTPGPSDGEKTPSPDPSSRKNSWTDILFFRSSRSRSRSKSPIGSESSCKSPPCGQINCDESVSKQNKKGGFLSFLKFSRKSSTSTTTNGENLSSPSMPSHENAINDNNDYVNYSTPRVSVTDTSKNDFQDQLVVFKDLSESHESRQDVSPAVEQASHDTDTIPDSNPDSFSDIIETSKASNIAMTDAEIPRLSSDNEDFTDSATTSLPVVPPPPPVCPSVFRKLKTRSDTIADDCQSLPERLPSSCKPRDSSVNLSSSEIEKTKAVADIMEDTEEHLSSGSEDPDNDSNATLFAESTIGKSPKIDSLDPLEKETLLTQDHTDTEDCSAAESLSTQPPTNLTVENFNSQLKISSKKDRLDVSLAPLERPRSTTPINVASMEAFINSAPTNIDPNFERLRVSLPGDQFSGQQRSKSPRRSNPQIWSKFCEKGLQSPKNRRQRSNTIDDCQLKPSIAVNDAFMPFNCMSSPIETPLNSIDPFGSGDNWTPFEDDFNSLRFSSNYQEECKRCNCLEKSGITEDNLPSTKNDEQNIKNKEGSNSDEKCECDCHLTTNPREDSEKPKLETAYSTSSDVSSASSRLIQASPPSSSKQSSIDDGPEEPNILA
ncbi:uncharacterized protein LOC141850066 [Brevipalpus obovatus]|uniref:uncharacterized protein LOC141850066 n=1 Tax=Brevipalpus obovatus TaxID=246614 RepID=UPI003D9ED8DF